MDIGVTFGAETLSLILLTAAFVLFTRLAIKAKTTKSLQFELFLFSAILFVSEVPRILETLGVIEMERYLTIGLVLHTVAMAVLSAAITYRFYRLLSSGEAKIS